MTNTQTPSGQRPPATNRPTDAELGRVLDAAAMTIHRLARLVVPEVAADARNVRDRIAAAADALDAAPARLTPEQWREAVERATRAAGNVAKPRTLALSDKILRAAFPHLAPDA